MPDLTDSFCERCGTRYAFASGAPKGLSFKGARVLAKGLKNFVLTDGQSIADAMELARQEDGHEASSRATEAFHRTFNFCMVCRQYACDRCWNTTAGACFSCAPTSEAADVESTPVGAPATSDWSLSPDQPVVVSTPAPPPFYQPMTFSDHATETSGRPAVPAAWPTIDLPDDPPVVTVGSNGKNGHAPKPPDPEAVKLWPISDEIAPEMTLTPEELELVETQLSQQTAAPNPAETVPEPPAPLLEQKETWWNRNAEDETAPVEWALPTSSAEEAATPSFTGSADTTDIATVEAAAIPEQPVEEALEAIAAEPEPEPGRTDSPLPAHLLHMTATEPVLPPITSITRPEPVAEPTGLVARLLRRRAADGTPAAQPTPRRVSPSKGHESGDPWPLATAWTERSFEGAHWSRGLYATSDEQPATQEAEAPVLDPAFDQPADDQPAAMPDQVSGPVASPEPNAIPAAAAAPGDEGTSQMAPAAPSVPAPVVADTAEIDPRTAAAIRLSAVDAATAQTEQPVQEQVSSAAPDAAPAAPAAPAASDSAHAAPAVPAPIESSTADIDPRAAAALRLLAVDAARATAQYQEDDRESFDDFASVEPIRRSPSREPAWLRIQREAAEMPDRPIELPDREDEAVPAAAQAATAVPAPAPPAPAAAAEPIPEAAPASSAAPAADVTPQPRLADAPAPVPSNPWPPLGASWPTRESPGAPWPGPDATSVPAVVAAQQIPAQTMAEMWVESSQEVMSRGSVRSCHKCALPVSTQARFCRRCGTPQS